MYFRQGIINQVLGSVYYVIVCYNVSQSILQVSHFPLLIKLFHHLHCHQERHKSTTCFGEALFW